MDVRNRNEQTEKSMPLGGYTVAVIGSWVAFLPLLQILLPLKANEIDPRHATSLLGVLAASGAAVAGVANLAVGWASDRTTSRFGRRRPWMVAGLAGIVASYAAIWQAHTAFAAFAAFAAFQLTFNMLFSPLLALMSDHVAQTRRGWASALVGLGKPVGTVVGTVAIGALLTNEGDRFFALAAIVLLSTAPFALRLRESGLPTHRAIDERPHQPGRQSWYSGSFMLAWLSRVFVLMAFTVAQLYLLYYLQALTPGMSDRDLGGQITILAIVFGTVSAVAGLIAGRLSDRTGRRRPFVIGSTIAIGLSMAALGEAPSLPIVILSYAFFAAGAGVHVAVEFAMIVDILPSRDHAARDLGLINVSNILPQILAPLAVGGIETLPGSSISWAFGASAVAAAVAGLLVAFMKGVR